MIMYVEFLNNYENFISGFLLGLLLALIIYFYVRIRKFSSGQFKMEQWMIKEYDSNKERINELITKNINLEEDIRILQIFLEILSGDIKYFKNGGSIDDVKDIYLKKKILDPISPYIKKGR